MKMSSSGRSVAFSRMHLPDGTVLKMQVVSFDAGGAPLAYHSLQGEEAFTEWRGGDFFWKGR